MKRYREPEARCAECGGYVPVYDAPLSRGGAARYGHCVQHRDAEVVVWSYALLSAYELIVSRERTGTPFTLEECTEGVTFQAVGLKHWRKQFTPGNLTTAWLLREKWRKYDQPQPSLPRPVGAARLFG